MGAEELRDIVCSAEHCIVCGAEIDVNGVCAECVSHEKKHIILFHYDSGPFFHEKRVILAIHHENELYICEWGIGWDDGAYDSCEVFKESVASFLRRIKQSRISRKLRQKERDAKFARLIRVKDNVETIISKPVFLIGRGHQNNDCNLSLSISNNFVARLHARISLHNESYYITDFHSRNQTFVDGDVVLPGTEVELSHGAKVRFANEEFVFLAHG